MQEIHERERRLYELVDRVLVAKTTGLWESVVACNLVHLILGFVRVHDLAIVTGVDGAMRLAPGLIRIPDAAFTSWERLLRRRIPKEPIPTLSPDLAVEVLSRDNTRKEMQRKCHDYFEAGVQLVWYVDPVQRTVRVFTSAERSTLLRNSQVLTGGNVLPGFAVPVSELFASLPLE